LQEQHVNRDELTDRLRVIHAELESLVMYAAAWDAFSEDERREVRLRWGGVVIRTIADIRWNWHAYARWGERPDWWRELARAVRDNRLLIAYLELDAPDLSTVERPAVRRIIYIERPTGE
jgi:hypothetical protein